MWVIHYPRDCTVAIENRLWWNPPCGSLFLSINDKATNDSDEPSPPTGIKSGEAPSHTWRCMGLGTELRIAHAMRSSDFPDVGVCDVRIGLRTFHVPYRFGWFFQTWGCVGVGPSLVTITSPIRSSSFSGRGGVGVFIFDRWLSARYHLLVCWVSFDS